MNTHHREHPHAGIRQEAQRATPKPIASWVRNRTFGYALFFFACTILSVNATRSIINSYSVGAVYLQRKQNTERQYLELIKKKNELDYISSPFFIEKQLRESLNYYRKGEKLLVFTRPLNQTAASTAQTTEATVNPLQQWISFLSTGIVSPYE